MRCVLAVLACLIGCVGSGGRPSSLGAETDETDATTDRETGRRDSAPDSGTGTETGQDTDSDTAPDTDPQDSTPSTPSCAPVPSGALWWVRAEDDGTDLLGTLAPGSLQGGASFVDGKVGRAMSFGGVSGVFTTPAPPAAYFAGSFTLEAWVRPHALEGYFVSLYECGGACPSALADSQIELLFRDARPQGRLRAPGSSLVHVYAPQAVLLHAWHHVAVVRDVVAKVFLLYLDGALLGTTSLPEPAQRGRLLDDDGDQDPLVFGASEMPGQEGVFQNFLEGELDEITAYGRALTATEIATIVAADSAGKCAP